ncbi:regulator of (H+)-ATPase in vacuolar membrane [Coemansia sp. RSA 552]|nr:regulator of (H+)-ATPase in vacuolar membrane [Coemansia sp. RSA 552]
MWTRTEDQWVATRSWSTGCAVDMISAWRGEMVFASASFDSPLVRVWHYLGDAEYLRLQYVVHPQSVRGLFWHQGADPRIPPSNMALYTITRTGQLYMWCVDGHSGMSSGSGAWFVMAGSLRYVHGNSKYLVAAGVCQQQPPAETPQRGSSVEPAGNGDNAGESVVEDHRPPHTNGLEAPVAGSAGVSKHSRDDASSWNVSEHRAASAPAAAVAGPLETTPVVTDWLYAVFSDGSLEIWKMQHPHRQSSVSSSSLVTRTGAVNAELLSFFASGTPNVLSGSLLWLDESYRASLALADIVGHIFQLSTAQPVDNSSTPEQQPLCLRSLWDGHKESIFHISVDPYSARIATHSTEGELLIWDTIDTGSAQVAVSRRMALDESHIRTIAWAPMEHEFIAATDKRVYRLQYSRSGEEWIPRDSEVPQMGPYDRIFTYPAGTMEELAERGPDSQCGYYISTVELASRTVQTWLVPGPSRDIEFVGRSELQQTQNLDRAARVMPVSHPFFSHDNILATFDASEGRLDIWGIRATPELEWFCTKEHRIPCLSVDMIRYNSIDKAAIVSTDKDGEQTVTVWVFSSASRRSHYLPAGTIHPRRKGDRVREVRWHLTEYAQTYLGVQWDDQIDVYCQVRNIDNGWVRVCTISGMDFGAPDKDIGSFSFTAAGEPTFSVGKQLFVCAPQVGSGQRLSDVAYDEHGELPLVHPFILGELMSWGKIGAAKRLLSMLYDHLRAQEMDGRRTVVLPLIPMQDLLGEDDKEGGDAKDSNQSIKGAVAGRYAALLGAGLGDDVVTMDASQPDFEQFTQEKADYVAEKLTEVKLAGLSPIDQTRLLSIVGSITSSQLADQAIDAMGTRYLIKLQLLELENKRTRSAQELTYRELNWAQHSQSQAVLLQVCLQRHTAGGLTWAAARRMGLFMWLSNVEALRAEVEKMARSMFVSEGRDPTKCAIFYLALGKRRLLEGLWRTAHAHPERGKMLTFLANDFSEQRWRTAAAKNAYVLLSRQRYLDAATFFMLAGKLRDAAAVCVVQLRDVQLAVTICRCHEGDSGPVLKDVLWRLVLPDALRRQDRWLASLAFGLVQRYDLVQRALTDDLGRLGTQIGVTADVSGYSAMDVLDTELLILYHSMLGYSSTYRAPLATQAELIAQTITIFECLGAPVMSLVVLEWWRRELFAATKPSTSTNAKKQPVPATNPVNVTDPAMGGIQSMDIFAKFMGGSPAPQPAQKPAEPSPPPDSSGSVCQAESNGSPALPGSDTPALAASGLEDTPVQYACRVTLALQIIEFVDRSRRGGAAVNVEQEKATVAATLRLPMSVFPDPVI